MDASQVLVLLAVVWEDAWFKGILALLVLNVASGLAAALYTRSFYFGSLADFLLTRALPYVLVDGALQFVLRIVLAGADLGSIGLDTLLGAGVHVAVMLALVSKVADNLRDMGLPIPNVLGSMPKPAAKATP